MIALRFLGSDLTRLRTRVLCKVVWTLLLAVLGWVQCRPVSTALRNKRVLRAITLIIERRDLNRVLWMLILLICIDLEAMLHSCGINEAIAAPLVLEGLISVTSRFGLVWNAMFCSIGLPD